MMCCNCTASVCSEAMNAGSGSARPSCAASSQPRILLSGVRSSWATSLTMSLRCASRRARWSAMSLKAAAKPADLVVVGDQHGLGVLAVPHPLRRARERVQWSCQPGSGEHRGPDGEREDEGRRARDLRGVRGERSKPGTVVPSSSPMNSRAGEAT